MNCTNMLWLVQSSCVFRDCYSPQERWDSVTRTEKHLNTYNAIVYMHIAIYSILMLMLHWCNCIRFVKYRQTIAPEAFIMAAIFLWLAREKATDKPQKIAQLIICRCFQHNIVFIGCK